MHPFLIIYTDGGSRGNPGFAAIGVVVKNDQENIIHQFGRYIGIYTNNVAEYTAVQEAINWIILNQQTSSPLFFKLDSKLVVEQLSHRWKIKEASLFALATSIWEQISVHHLTVSFTHIPRSLNFLADAQVNLALNSRPH